MKALITGITGSGGSYLAEYLVDNVQDLAVYGTSRWHSTTHNRNLDKIRKDVNVLECDLMDLGSIVRILNQVRPDYIFHLAAYANVRASFDTPLAVLQNNVMSTANLFEAVRMMGEMYPYRQLPKIQLCSSPEIYGVVGKEDIPIKETCALRPANPYAVSKLTQDALGDVYYRAFDIPIVRTRMFTYVNPKREDLFATSFAKQIVRIEKGLQEELVHGNLDSVRTIIDVRDAMSAYWAAMQYGQVGEVYNIGGEKVITVREFLDLLISKAQCPIVTKFDTSLSRPVDVTLQIPDTTKFREHTGWRSQYSFEETVEFLLDYCRSVYGSR